MTIQQAIEKKYIRLEKISETEYWVIEVKTGHRVTTVSGPDDDLIKLTINKKGVVTGVMV